MGKHLRQQIFKRPSISKQTTKEATSKIGYALKAMGIKTHRKNTGVVIQHTKPEISDRIDEMTKRYLKNEDKV